MEIHDFYAIYDKIIKSYIEEILERDKSVNCLKLIKRRIQKIYVYYEQKRIEVRKQYMRNSNSPLDRHKIASCLAFAILKSRVFKVNRLKSNIPEELLLANEYLAFYVAINIVEMFKRFESDYKFNNNYILIFPKTFHEDSDHEENTFVYNTCKGFSFIKNLNYFDIIAYSTILFQLERYTDTILENDEKVCQLQSSN